MSKKVDGDPLLREIIRDLRSELKGTQIYVMGDGDYPSQPKEWISTEIDTLDMAITGRADQCGIPVGKTVEIFGSEVTGKSALVAKMLGAAQRQGCHCGLIEGEEAWLNDFFILMSNGGDPGKVYYMDPDSLEDMWECIETFIDRIRQVDQVRPIFIAVDSLAGFSTQDELAGSFDEASQPGVAARKNRQGFRKLKKKFARERVIVVFVNQETAKIGSFGFGEKSTTSGGGGPKFFTSIRLQLDNIGKIKNKAGEEIGMTCQTKIYKNRFDMSGKKITYPILKDVGISNHHALVDFLYTRGFLGKTQGKILWDGKSFKKAEFIDQMRKDPTVYEAVRALVKEKFFGPAAIAEDPDIVEGVA